MSNLVFLGDSAIMLPVAAAITAWLATGRALRLAAWWSLLFILGLALVGISKIAFLGWGSGLPAIDFKAFSGHAMRTTAVAPVLFYMVLQRCSIRVRNIGVALGLLAGAGMGILLVTYDYHSVAETLAGWVLGAMISLTFVGLALAFPAVDFHKRFIPIFVLTFLVTWAVMPVSMPYIMTHVAMYLSGNPETYNWESWKREP